MVEYRAVIAAFGILLNRMQSQPIRRAKRSKEILQSMSAQFKLIVQNYEGGGDAQSGGGGNGSGEEGTPEPTEVTYAREFIGFMQRLHSQYGVETPGGVLEEEDAEGMVIVNDAIRTEALSCLGQPFASLMPVDAPTDAHDGGNGAEEVHEVVPVEKEAARTKPGEAAMPAPFTFVEEAGDAPPPPPPEPALAPSALPPAPPVPARSAQYNVDYSPTKAGYGECFAKIGKSSFGTCLWVCWNETKLSVCQAPLPRCSISHLLCFMHEIVCVHHDDTCFDGADDFAVCMLMHVIDGVLTWCCWCCGRHTHVQRSGRSCCCSSIQRILRVCRGCNCRQSNSSTATPTASGVATRRPRSTSSSKSKRAAASKAPFVEANGRIDLGHASASADAVRGGCGESGQRCVQNCTRA